MEVQNISIPEGFSQNKEDAAQVDFLKSLNIYCILALVDKNSADFMEKKMESEKKTCIADMFLKDLLEEVSTREKEISSGGGGVKSFETFLTEILENSKQYNNTYNAACVFDALKKMKDSIAPLEKKYDATEEKLEKDKSVKKIKKDSADCRRYLKEIQDKIEPAQFMEKKFLDATEKEDSDFSKLSNSLEDLSDQIANMYVDNNDNN